MESARKIKIAVCGAARGTFKTEFLAKSFAIGKAIAERGAMLVTGGTTGYPYEAAKGAVSSGGMSLGISPASDHQEHEGIYQKPTDVYDPMIYTGYGFVGRNVIIVKSSDAVIFIDGGTGTLNGIYDRLRCRSANGHPKGIRRVGRYG